MSRVSRDNFVQRGVRLTESDESDESGHPRPPTCDVCRTSRTLSWATGRDRRVAAARRIEYQCLRAWRPGVEESEATRRAAAKKGETTVALCLSERRIDSSLRLYNLSRTVSHQL